MVFKSILLILNMESQSRKGNIYVKKDYGGYFLCVETEDGKEAFLHANSFDLSAFGERKKLKFPFILPGEAESYDPERDSDELAGHATSDSSAILYGEKIDLILPRRFGDKYQSFG